MVTSVFLLKLIRVIFVFILLGLFFVAIVLSHSRFSLANFRKTTFDNCELHFSFIDASHDFFFCQCLQLLLFHHRHQYYFLSIVC